MQPIVSPLNITVDIEVDQYSTQYTRESRKNDRVLGYPLKAGGAIKSAVSSIIGCMIVYISVTVVFLERRKK